MLHLPLRTVDFILNEFEKKLSNYSIKTHEINSLEKVLVIEDSLVLYVGKIKYTCNVLNTNEIYKWTKNNKYMDMPLYGETYYELYIEELTYNSLGFKYNHSKFIRDIEKLTKIDHLGLNVQYRKFKGYTRLYWCPEEETLVEKIDKKLPKLKLRERYEIWEGINYYFIIMEINSIEGNTEYAVAYTTQEPNKYVDLRVKQWFKGKMTGNEEIRMTELKFYKAFNSWQKRDKNSDIKVDLKHIFIEKTFKEKDQVWRYADELLKLSYQGYYNEEQKNTYTYLYAKHIREKSDIIWITEWEVYDIVCNLYKDFEVIYQHRPFYLKSDKGGQMSYDVFISKLNIAIEYQGQQHFYPVKIFGGDEGFKRTQERDKLKKEISIKNNITLIYINYDETISEQLIKDRIDDAIKMIRN